MDMCRCMIVTMGALLGMVLLAQAQSDLFRCKQADGGIKFSDHGGPGCRKGEYKADIQHVEREPSTDEPAAASSPPDAGSAAAPRTGSRRSSQPFPAATRSVPSLAVRDIPAELRAKGVSIPNKGDITIVQLAVSHVPGGTGPHISADAHFIGTARPAFETAVLAAAKAVHYDPRHLSVQLTMPVGFGLLQGVHVDGPSAGVAWTVAIVSAILGDPLRSDVCLSGTMGLDLKVGPVSGLEHKIEGCHMLRDFRELLLPAGQNTFTITDKGMARSIKVTEVSTLAEAYQIATGRELRAFQ